MIKDYAVDSRQHSEPTERAAAAPEPRHTLWLVQLLRAAAALMVVIGHSQSAVELIKRNAGLGFVRSTVLPWGASVDLFFVISGFIMVYASRRLFGQPGSTGQFLKRRLARIVPLYWIITTLFLALLLAATLKGGDRFPSATAIAASYAFVPFDTFGAGHAFPVFDLGWTLNYEMFFYALFAIAVILPRRRAVVAVAVTLLLLVVAGVGVPDDQVVLHFWTRPIILDFGLGMGVGLALSEGVRLPRWIRLALMVASLAMLVLDPAHVYNGPVGMTVANGWPRVLVAGIPSAALLAAAILGPEPRLRAPWVPLTKIGNASYSLYMIHPVALIVLEKLAQKLPAVRLLPGGLLVLVTVLAAIALALASFRWGERPMTARIARLLDSGAKPAPIRPRSTRQETAT